MEIIEEFIKRAEAIQKSDTFKLVNIEATNLKDCYILTPKRFGDNRGFFEQIDIEPLQKLGFKDFKKLNRSRSCKGTIRGLHFQKNPYAQTKVVSCVDGGVLDVVVDMRVDSPTYGQWTSVELTPENGRALYVPRGFAHGFVALKDNTYFEYIVDNVYNKESEGGIIWNDPDVNIDWQFDKYDIKDPIFSDKDQVHPTLALSPEYFKEVK